MMSSFFNCQKLILQTNKICKDLEGRTYAKMCPPSCSSGPKEFPPRVISFSYGIYLTSVLEQVGVAVNAQEDTPLPGPWRRPVWPGKGPWGASNPTWTWPCWGAGFSWRRSSKIQMFNGFTRITPQHKQGGRCVRDIKSNIYSQLSAFWRFKKIPFPSSFLKPNQGEGRLLLPLAATQNDVPSLTCGAWQ